MNFVSKDWSASHIDFVGQELIYRLVDEYFNRVGRIAFEEFWRAFVEEQEPLVAYGAPYLAVAPLQAFPYTDQVGIFSRVGAQSRGRVAPGSQLVGLELARANERIPAVRSELHIRYGFDSFRDSEIHVTLRIFMRFVSRAKRHYVDGHADEAFLHFVIALDLVLGETASATDTVTRRAAALVHRPLSRAYHEQKERIRHLYDARSRYVHDGKPVKPESKEEIEIVCHEVLLCLLRLQAVDTNHAPDFIATWLKRVDHIVTALEARVDIDEALLKANGIEAENS